MAEACPYSGKVALAGARVSAATVWRLVRELQRLLTGDTHVVHLEGLREGAWIRITAASSSNRRVDHQVHGHGWERVSTRARSRASGILFRPRRQPTRVVHGPRRFLCTLGIVARVLACE